MYRSRLLLCYATLQDLYLDWLDVQENALSHARRPAIRVLRYPVPLRRAVSSRNRPPANPAPWPSDGVAPTTLCYPERLLPLYQS